MIPSPAAPSRRQFLGAAAAFTLACGAGGELAATGAAHAEALPFAPNAFIRLTADGHFTIISSYLEMGQGTFTGLMTLAAEELDVPPSHITVEAAPADANHYANPMFSTPQFKVQGTGGSTAMAGAWTIMRTAAATARAMLLTAAATAWRVPAASLTVKDGVITDPASGRHAGYGRFAAAAARLPVPKSVALKPSSAFTLIGDAKTRRIDIPSKVNGTAVFTQDIKRPGMLVAVIAHPPRLFAKPAHIDAAAAKAIQGVEAVLEIPGDDEVQGGVAVLAKNTWVARQGRDALKITWDDTGALRKSSSNIADDFRALAATPGDVAVSRGQVLTAAPAGGHLIEAVFEQPYLAHAAMEPMNCLIHFHGKSAEVWNGEQFQTFDQAGVARELGLKPADVTITQLYAGGSFGRRANPRSDYVREAARIAKAAAAQGIHAPIKLVWMREDDMRAAQYRPLTIHAARLVLDAAGNLVSWQHRVVGQSFMPPKGPNKIDDSLMEGMADMPYEIPNFRAEQHIAGNVAVPTQWLRSVGHTHAAVVGETLMDEAARAAGKDPYQFRRALLANHPRHRAVLELAAEKSGWGTPLLPTKPGDKRGRGIALQQSFGTYVAHVAEVTIHPDGTYRVDRFVTAVDCGIAINPAIIEAQMQGGIGFGLAFLRQAITLKDGQVEQGNFDTYPVLRMDAMPKVEVHIVPSPAPPTGVGEPGVPPAAPAVLNALYSVTGVPVRALPIGDSVRAA